MELRIEVKEDPAGKNGLYIRKRELAVIRWIVQGKPNKEIAVLMGIKEATVEMHRHNALKRLGCSSTPELIHKLHIAKILSEDGNNPS